MRDIERGSGRGREGAGEGRREMMMWLRSIVDSIQRHVEDESETNYCFVYKRGHSSVPSQR